MGSTNARNAGRLTRLQLHRDPRNALASRPGALLTTLVAALLLTSVGSTAAAPVKTKDPDLTAQQPTIDLPYMPGLVIDGKAEDWGDGGYKVLAMVDDEGQPSDPANFSCRFRLAWDDQGIIVLGHVTDDQWIEHPTPEEIWKKDGLEMFMAEAPGSDNYFQALVAPGMAKDQPEPRAVSLFRGDVQQTLKLKPPDVGIVRNSHGYTIEARMPFANLGMFPRMGDTLAFQLFFDDADHADANNIYPRNIVWFPATLAYLSSMRMHRVRLAASASPPVLAASIGFNVKSAGDPVTMVLATPLPGEAVEIRHGSEVLATAPAPSGEGLQTITFNWPHVLGDEPARWLTIHSGGQEIGTFLVGNEYPAIRGISRDKFDTPEARQLQQRIADTIHWTDASWPQRIMSYKHTPAIAISVAVALFLIFTIVWVYRSRRLTLNNI